MVPQSGTVSWHRNRIQDRIQDRKLEPEPEIDPKFADIVAARKVAAFIGTQHHEVYFSLEVRVGVGSGVGSACGTRN